MSKVQAMGSKIEEIRIRNGLSANELAVKAGLSEFGLKSIECGRTKFPRPKTAKAIADALEVSFDELFSIVSEG